MNDLSCDVDIDIDWLLSSGFLNESQGIFSSSDENTSEKSMVVEEQPLHDTHVEDNADQSSKEKSDATDKNIEIRAPRKRRRKADPEKWTITLNKKKRIKGMSYSGVQVISEDKENVDSRERHIPDVTLVFALNLTNDTVLLSERIYANNSSGYSGQIWTGAKRKPKSDGMNVQVYQRMFLK